MPWRVEFQDKHDHFIWSGWTWDTAWRVSQLLAKAPGTGSVYIYSEPEIPYTMGSTEGWSHGGLWAIDYDLIELVSTPLKANRTHLVEYEPGREIPMPLGALGHTPQYPWCSYCRSRDPLHIVLDCCLSRKDRFPYFCSLCGLQHLTINHHVMSRMVADKLRNPVLNFNWVSNNP